MGKPRHPSGIPAAFRHKHGVPTIEEAREKYPHGTNARYVLARCRCLPCGVAASDYNLALRQARRGPWYVKRLTAKENVQRDRVDAKHVRCRFCRTPKHTYQITVHERRCEQNPQRMFPLGWVVLHRDGGEQNVPLHVSRAAADAACKRLNKRDRPKPDDEFVSADRVRRHLHELQRAGLGCKAISKASGVAYSSLQRMFAGAIRRTRRQTEAKVLAVTAGPDRLIGRNIPAEATIRMLNALIAVGYRRGWIALQLGAKYRALQIGKTGSPFVRADKARAIKALYERLWVSDAKLREHVDPGHDARLAGDTEMPVATTPDRGTPPQPVPLSKRDPAIAARWAALTFRSF